LQETGVKKREGVGEPEPGEKGVEKGDLVTL